jgi:hypothetical protein
VGAAPVPAFCCSYTLQITLVAVESAWASPHSPLPPRWCAPRYNEKADVYSFGILVWFVAQYLHLCYNPQLWNDRKEFMHLMRPYDKGTFVRLAQQPWVCSFTWDNECVNHPIPTLARAQHPRHPACPFGVCSHAHVYMPCSLAQHI